MSERQVQSMKGKLLRLQNLLSSDTATDSTAHYLKEVLIYFASADLDNEAVAKNEVYEQLRDTVKAVFGYLDRARNPASDLPRTVQSLIKQLLLAVCGFCSAFYYHYHPLGCGEMIRDFLSSECRLFAAEIAGAERVEEKEEGEAEWKWAKPCTFKTSFFSKCIEIIMSNLSNLQAKFEEMRAAVIAQYLHLLYYIDDYIFKDKLDKLCLSHIQSLQKLFRNPSKEIMKEASKQSLEQVIDYATRLLRNVKSDDLKRRVQVLGVTLGMSMIKLPSIEKKIVGCKIVNKFSYDMLYKNNFSLSEQHYAEWLIKEGFFEAVFQDHCQASTVKLSDDSFKLLVKRGCIDKPRFQRFFQVLEKADAELRKAMFRLIDPFRVDYYQIETINQIFKTIRGPQFYDDQFFYFYEGISRYATQSQLVNMIGVVEQALNKHYAAFTTYLTRRRAIECYAYIFEKLIIYKDMPQRILAYQRVAQQFLDNPNESSLIMIKTLFNNLTEARLTLQHQEQLAVSIVDKMKFLSKMLPAASNPVLKEDLLYLLRNLLQKYRNSQQRAGFGKEALLEAVGCPDVFEEMLKALREGEVDGLLQKLSTLAAVTEFSFSCIRWTFIRLNKKCLRPIKKEYVDIIATNATIDNISNFQGIDTLTYLIFNSQRQAIRRGASELLAQIATNFASDFRQQGEVYLAEFLQVYYAVIVERVNEFLSGKGSQWSVIGALQLAEALMLATEYFGVGSLKAHNSQVPTSSVWLRVYNNCCLGEDSLKIFQKKFPSNRTLFQVIRQAAAQFKIGPLDIGLEFPNIEIIKHHGLTLQQLKLNGQELNAVRLPQSRTKIEPLLSAGELSPKAKTVFTAIFNQFAVNGYLGHKQCAAYVNGVTMTYCPINDHRVSDLFYKYDLDKDDKITLDDLLRFYKDCIEDPNKLQNVEKNLINLHYRNDLQPYDAEIDFNEQVLFRFYASNNNTFYDQLFSLCNHCDSPLAKQAQTLLLRLPTYSKVVDSLAQTFDLKGRNSFEIEYLLTALQTHLNSHDDVANALISKGNHLSIFEYLTVLAAKESRAQNDKNCLVICLHVLRSLLGSFSLREVSLVKPHLSFTLPTTDVFINIIRESIKNNDSTLLEPAFALQLTQQELPVSMLQESAFSRDKDTRALTCHFLYLWLLSGKAKDLNLFTIPINPNNNQEWFSLLAFLTHFDQHIDLNSIFQQQLTSLANNSESLEGTRYNPIIFGSLTLIKEIYDKLNKDEKQQLNHCLDSLLPHLISNQNRTLAYDLRSKFPQILLADLQRVVNIEMSKQGQPRNGFVGIRNLGCICYMNSILQQFFMIRQFYSLLLSLHAKEEQSTVDGVQLVDDFLYQLQQMYVNLEWSQKQYYDPTTFCLAVKDYQGKPIKTHIQQDAHEFLNTAFDKIEGYTKKEERLKDLQRLFGGKTVTEIICQTCKNKNQVLQHYYHLSVEVKGMKTLKESLDKFIQPEQISDYFCSDCNRKVQKITKQIMIKQSPQILIINLQRIIFDLETFLKVKVHTRLQFQHTLDLHNYFSSSSQPAPYRLKGVVIHAGTSQGGHYYSLIKHQDKWFKFNDQSVTQFNEADIGREAFGGEDVTDHWGEHTSSTNAYILFYERVKEREEESAELKSQPCAALIDKVKKQNKKFAAQIQYNQPSFFNALNQTFQKYTNPYLPQNQQIVKSIGNIYYRVLEHLIVNSDIKTQLITEVRDNILAITDIIQESSSKTLQNYRDDHYRQVITNFNDVNIRDIYSKLLAKSLKNGIKQTNIYIASKAKTILNMLLGWIKDEAFLKNLHKSYQYFELIKDLVSNSTQIRESMINQGYIALYLDLLMGSESILNRRDKKKAQFHSSQAIPVVEIINVLISDKFARQCELNNDEKRIINQSNFYRRTMKNKLDMGLLAPIIAHMSKNNEQFSKMIAEVLLRAMNSYDQVQDKSIVFNNMRSFLLVEDDLSLQRLKWIYGIPQLQCIHYQRPQFGLMTSSQSLVYSYASSLFYIKDEKYQPFLFSLFEKRKYFNSFSAYGTLALLELVNQSPRVLNYLLSLPSPVYVRKSYFGWIQNFTLRIQIEEHFGLPMDKKVLHQKLEKLTQTLKTKLQKNDLYLDLPVNRYIIGKNVQLKLEQKYSANNIKIDMFSHITYVLQNRPQGAGNLSLPDDQYSFANIKQPVTAKYFLKCNEMDFSEDVPIDKRLTMLTFEITNQAPFSIKFKMPKFQNKIHLKAGTHSINAPYFQGTIADLLEIVQQVKQEAVVAQKQEMIVQQLPPIMTSLTEPIQAAPSNDYFMEIECKACTYLNIGREKCEICDSDLFI